MSHFLVLGSPTAAYSPGLWMTDLSVLRFQETCNANVPLVGRVFIKKMEHVIFRYETGTEVGRLCSGN